MKYAVVIERAEGNFSAYVPDLPGCVAVGDTLAEVESMIREAIAFHLDGMREDGQPIPEPSTVVELVDVARRRPVRRMNATRLGIIAFVAASALFAVALYSMLSRSNEDAVTELPDFSGIDLQGGSPIVALFERPPRTVTEERTTAKADGDTTVTRTKRYDSGDTLRIDTLNDDGSVAMTRIHDVECDWAARTCRRVRDESLRLLPDLLRTRHAGTGTPRPTADLSGLEAIPTARITTSERTMLGEGVTCTLNESPLGSNESCITSDGITLYSRTIVDGTTTTIVATELLRFIPYEAVALPFPLEE